MRPSTHYRALFAVLALALAGALSGFDLVTAAWAIDNLPPGMTITPQGEPIVGAPPFIPASLAPWWNWIATPAFLFWLAGQFRAWFPFLGQLGWLTWIGDALAGNYRHAKNADS